MNTYTIDETDLGLMADLAGGFNDNRVGKPPTTRFDASVNWVKADRFSTLVKRLKQPEEPAPPPVNPPPGATIPVTFHGDLGGATVDVSYEPGQAHAFRATAAGNGSASINEGGVGLYGGAFAAGVTTVNESEFTTWGKVAVNAVALQADQWLVLYSEAPFTLPGRADIH